jgi:creatinine amidohydrolase
LTSSTRKLAELSGPATKTMLTADSVIVLPIGAVEHHGPHLPLITDSLIAESVSSAAVERGVAAGLDLWQLPTLSFTKSDEHHWASGTMWISWDSLMSTLIDIGRSVANTPARRLVFINGHGGNTALLGVANRELRRQFGLATFSMGAGNVVAASGTNGEPDERGMGIHAGHGETSLVMHLRPDLVQMELAERNIPEHMADLECIGFNGYPVSFGWQSNDFGPTGVIGDPTGSSAKRGAELFESSVERTVKALTEISTFSPRAGV